MVSLPQELLSYSLQLVPLSCANILALWLNLGLKIGLAELWLPGLLSFGYLGCCNC